MFSNSEVKGHPMRSIISTRRREMQKQNSDAHINFFKCPICSFRTPLRGDLQKHISMYHKQVFVCKICTSKFSSRSDLAEHKRLSHLDYPMDKDEGRVYSCQKCGSRFDNAKIFAVHVKVTCLKGDFIKQSGKKTNFQPHNASAMVKKTAKYKINQKFEEEKRFRDKIQFHQLPKSQGFFENDDKRTTMLSAFFGNQALNLKSTRNIKKENRFEDSEDKYSTCSGCGYLVLQDYHSCQYNSNQSQVQNNIRNL